MTTEPESPQRRSRRAPAAAERQRDPERTKARILEAASIEFAAKGYAGARVSEIAARAGVNQQLIAYYFDGKRGLYREMGRTWLAYEQAEMPHDLDFAELIRRYVRASVQPGLSGRLLAWEGLADGADDRDEDEERERTTRMQHDVEGIRERQRAGELPENLDPAVLFLVGVSAANALAVYPQLTRSLFGDRDPADLAEHYGEQLAKFLARP